MVCLEGLSRVAPAGLLLAGLIFATAVAQGEESAPSEPAPEEPSSSASQPTAPATSEETTASAKVDETDPMDVIVCKAEPPMVGSRLGKRRICKTRREWRDEDLGADGRRRLPEEHGTPVPPGMGGSTR